MSPYKICLVSVCKLGFSYHGRFNLLFFFFLLGFSRVTLWILWPHRFFSFLKIGAVLSLIDLSYNREFFLAYSLGLSLDPGLHCQVRNLGFLLTWSYAFLFDILDISFSLYVILSREEMSFFLLISLICGLGFCLSFKSNIGVKFSFLIFNSP